jgi:hypothetical protein
LLLFQLCILLLLCSFHIQTAAAGCLNCHAVTLDARHDLPCISCHQGDDTSSDKGKAHSGMIAQPAHPDSMEASCGACHRRQVDDIRQAGHFTLANLVNMTRRAFGAESDLKSMAEIPEAKTPETPLALVDDLLRRRCLRCHLFFKGDDWPAVTHGTGCAACHLDYNNGRLSTHTFLAIPGDRQCLSCHYGNRVGFDYYGRFEHDLNAEYRTPYTTKEEHFRPYGVEYHELAPDIHQQRGLVCTDCHSGQDLMRHGEQRPSCIGCHDTTRLGRSLPERVRKTDNGYVFLAGPEKREHPLPLMSDPAHQPPNNKVACQVCHAQWSFNDFGKHLLLSQNEDVDDWERLTTQGSSEVTKLLENNTDFQKDAIFPAMSDKIHFRNTPGIWYKGFIMRRWEGLHLMKHGIYDLEVSRPLLDLYISWLDGNGHVQYDSHPSEASNNGLYRYTPHTTGKAGLLYRQRLETLQHAETAKENRKKD